MTSELICMLPGSSENSWSAHDVVYERNSNTMASSRQEACPLADGFAQTNERNDSGFWRGDTGNSCKSSPLTRLQRGENSAHKAANALVESSSTTAASPREETRTRVTHIGHPLSRFSGSWAFQSSEDYWADASVSLASPCSLDVDQNHELECCMSSEELIFADGNASIEDTDNLVEGRSKDLQDGEEEQIERVSHEIAYSSEEEYWSCKEDDTSMAEDTRYSSRYGAFPPPINPVAARCDTSRLPAVVLTRVCLQSIKKNGRFILREVRVCPQMFFRAHRENGRLRLHLIRPDDGVDSAEGAREEQKKGEPTTVEDEIDGGMHKDEEEGWKQINRSKEEEEEDSYSEEEESLPAGECEDAVDKASSIACPDHLLEREKDALSAASCPTEIVNSLEKEGNLPCNRFSDADFMQVTGSKQAQQAQRNSLRTREGARGLWAPTQSFLQKSLIRMRPVVG